jgi:uncharacterized membrane protein
MQYVTTQLCVVKVGMLESKMMKIAARAIVIFFVAALAYLYAGGG